ncbi:type-1 restriction enzyme R protein-like [Rattus rattus]|uniref:type-1 restriction enzyme R protein-like n=1 Tax=Rattus rattus TaxID=10117 RepID=UPI0013F2BCC7|nr:type-1 restriction enzyme R protein-like [Rattus rattus]
MSNSVITKIGPYSLLTKDKKEDTNSTKYQTREEMEGALISTLLDIGYEYRPDLNNEKALIDNLRIPAVQKVLFVVDRKDLDHQTCKEYENYSKGSVDGTKNSTDLENKLLDPIKSKKIIVTTIQKLSRLFGSDGRLKNKYFDEKIVIIIDECHRSQAGKMHESIIQHFRNANIFGFTGTPIMRDEEEGPANTSEIFGQCLHSYKICDAIIDANVLPFHYE